MFNKPYLPFLLAFLLSLFAAGTALAADEAPPAAGAVSESRRRPRAVAGEITAVDLSAQLFELRTRSGVSLTIHVDERTRYRGTVANLEDLQAGMRVVVAARPAGDGRLLAAAVAVPDPDNRQAVGVVESVDPASGTLTLATREGDRWTVQVDADTKYRGLAGSLDEIDPGMRALVGAREGETGAPVALWIAVPERLQRRRYAGQVTQVNPGEGTFAVRTFGGEELSFRVAENTAFRSPGQEVEGLEDLKQGMTAGVYAQPQLDGSLSALAVVAGTPRFELRVLGEITGLTPQGFTLRTADGRELAFKVDEKTRYRSPGGSVTSLADLEAGMKIAVGGRFQAGGESLALLIMAR